MQEERNEIKQKAADKRKSKCLNPAKIDTKEKPESICSSEEKSEGELEYAEISDQKRMNDVGINNGSPIEYTIAATTSKPWWQDCVDISSEFDITLSGKLFVLDKIINFCSKIGDKLLVFSQSKISLDIIEKYLEFTMKNNRNVYWVKDKDYFRMDGQTDLIKRASHVNNFNDPRNKRNRLFLISTRAGGIGINLIGANRCVIFDVCWNPSHDTQSIFRIYRMGQKKQVYIYRFIAQVNSFSNYVLECCFGVSGGTNIYKAKAAKKVLEYYYTLSLFR
jgi:SNF2 family DNA or RNA helicase